MSNDKIFMPFDEVVYTGEKFRQDLKGKVGIVTARVQRMDKRFVIDYGDDAYVFHQDLLDHYKPGTRDEKAKMDQEVYHRRKRKKDEDE